MYKFCSEMISWLLSNITLHNVCSVHRGMFSMSGGYHEYIGAYHEYIRGYHEYIGGCSVHRGFQYKSKAFINLLLHMNHDIPSMYSRYPPNVLMVAPDVLMVAPDVLMVSPRCAYGIPPMYLWYPPNELSITRCTAHTLYRVNMFKYQSLHMSSLKKADFYLGKMDLNVNKTGHFKII